LRRRKSAVTKPSVPRPHIEPVDLTLSTAIEVASVKAQAQAAARRLKEALHDIYGDVEELEQVIEAMPEPPEEDVDDLPGTGAPET
jgi:hypothetical protein